MPAPVLRASSLGDELSALTRDDRPRLDQILWTLEGDARRTPDDPLVQTALCHALSLAGRADDLRSRLRHLRHLHDLPHWLQLNIVYLMMSAGDFTTAASAIDPLLTRTDLGPADRTRLIDLATSLALRSGDLHLLARAAAQSPDDATPRRAIQLLQAHDLAARWTPQQTAVEAVLGAHTSHFHADLQTDEEYSSRIILDYYTDAPTFAALDELQAGVDTALERVYAAHPDGQGATLGVVVIAVHRPFIPPAEPV